MVFLIRMAFWFSLVLLVLPLDTGTTTGDGESVRPLSRPSLRPAKRSATLPASANAGPDVCETGKAAMTHRSGRAKAPKSRGMLDNPSAQPDTVTTTGGIPARTDRRFDAVARDSPSFSVTPGLAPLYPAS